MTSIYEPPDSYVAPSVRMIITNLNNQLNLLAMAKAAATSHIQVHNGATHGTGYLLPHERAIANTNNGTGSVPPHKRPTMQSYVSPHKRANANPTGGTTNPPPQMKVVANGPAKAAAANGVVDPMSLRPHECHLAKPIPNSAAESDTESAKLATQIESAKPAASNTVDMKSVPPHKRHLFKVSVPIPDFVKSIGVMCANSKFHVGS